MLKFDLIHRLFISQRMARKREYKIILHWKNLSLHVSNPVPRKRRGTRNCLYSALQKISFFCLFMKESKGCSRGHKLSLKCCYDHKLLNPSKEIIGLSKEVVYDLIDQRATKLQSLKVCSVRDSNPGRPESNDSLQ